jgi:hypothetical protein
VRQAAIFGIHGGHINVTDGRYVYMRAPASKGNTPLYNYTLMPTHMRSRFSVAELQEISLQEPFSFTKGVPTMKIQAAGSNASHDFGTLLYDVENDPSQTTPLRDAVVERRMIGFLKQLMEDNEAPPEQYVRLGL